MKHLIQLVFLLISSGCYSQKLKTFVHPTDGFEIGIPKRWNVKKRKNINLYVSGPKYEKYFREDGTILIHIQSVSDGSFDDIYNDYINFIGDKKVVNEIGQKEINGRVYKIYLIKYSSSNVNLTSLQYFTMKESKIFIASFTAMDSNYNKLEPLFQKVAETIKY